MLSDPQLHYLDNAATSRVDPAVAQAITTAMVEHWANPSSLYDPAVAAQDAIMTARARVAKTLHCRSDEIYFTACGSEGNNMAVYGPPAQALGQQNRRDRVRAPQRAAPHPRPEGRGLHRC